MRILHIWSCAGISSLIAKYMDQKYSTVSDIIITEKWNRHNLNDYRIEGISNKPLFFLMAILKAMDYDIIHIHYHSIFIDVLRLLRINKPIVLHFHGSDIRGRGKKQFNRIKKADYIFLSTIDLMSEMPNDIIDNWEYLPNPIDTIMFSKRDIENNNMAVTLNYNADDLAFNIAIEKGLSLIVLKDRIPHDEIPDVLSRYEYYVDIKRDFKNRLLKPLSNIGLEALSLGLKVIDSSGKIHYGFPKTHKPEYVSDIVYEIYNYLIEG